MNFQCVLLCLFREFSIKINNALMRKEMAWWLHCGNGRKNSGLWSHHSTWLPLRTTRGALPLCARMASGAKQVKKTVFYQGRVRKSICLMLWNLDKCWFKNNTTVFTYLLSWLLIGPEEAKRLWNGWRPCASLWRRAPSCVREAGYFLQIASATIVLWRKRSQVCWGLSLLPGRHLLAIKMSSSYKWYLKAKLEVFLQRGFIFSAFINAPELTF